MMRIVAVVVSAKFYLPERNLVVKGSSNWQKMVGKGNILLYKKVGKGKLMWFHVFK